MVDVGTCHFEGSFRMVMEYASQKITLVSINSLPDIILIDHLLGTGLQTEYGNKMFHPPFGLYQLSSQLNGHVGLGQRFIIFFIYFYLIKSLTDLEHLITYSMEQSPSEAN